MKEGNAGLEFVATFAAVFIVFCILLLIARVFTPKMPDSEPEEGKKRLWALLGACLLISIILFQFHFLKPYL